MKARTGGQEHSKEQEEVPIEYEYQTADSPSKMEGWEQLWDIAI